MVAFISCKTTISKEVVSSLDTSRPAQHFLDITTLQPNTIDTFAYSNLPYWDSTMNRVDDAYIDTFSVAGNRFRLINPFSNKSELDINVYLEKLIKDKWIFTGFTINFGNGIGNNYNHSKDINGDGFNDITENVKFVQSVYYFNPQTMNYLDTISKEYINPEWTLLDTATKLFCDFRDLKQMCGEIHSTLYTFKGFNKYNLYDLELYNCTEKDDNTDTITKLILRKCINGNLDSTIAVSETIPPHPIVAAYDSTYFDYKNYWQDKYKALLNYR